MAASVVYHWKHGWIPLDHTAALAKAHGSHKGAIDLLNAARDAKGIKSRADLRGAISDLPNLPAQHRTEAARQIKAAGVEHGVKLPGSREERAARHEAAFARQDAAARAAAERIGMTFPKPTVRSHGLIGPGATVEASDAGAETRLAQNRAAFPVGTRVSFREGQGPLHHGTVTGHSSSGVRVQRDEGGEATRLADDLGPSHKKELGPTNAEKITNAATMFGTGSKQHREAIRRFGK